MPTQDVNDGRHFVQEATFQQHHEINRNKAGTIIAAHDDMFLMQINHSLKLYAKGAKSQLQAFLMRFS